MDAYAGDAASEGMPGAFPLFLWEGAKDMTIRGAMDLFVLLTGQPLEEDLARLWLSELDGMAKEEIFDRFEGSPVPDGWSGYDETTSRDTALLIPAPYETLYAEWLRCKVDDWNQETKRYNGNQAAFNNHYLSFGDHWRRTHRTRQPKMIF